MAQNKNVVEELQTLQPPNKNHVCACAFHYARHNVFVQALFLMGGKI